MHLDYISEIMLNHPKRKEALDAFKQTRDEFIKPLLDKLVCLELRYSISSPMGKLIHALEIHKDDENNPLRLISKFYNITFDSDFPKIKKLFIGIRKCNEKDRFILASWEYLSGYWIWCLDFRKPKTILSTMKLPIPRPLYRTYKNNTAFIISKGRFGAQIIIPFIGILSFKTQPIMKSMDYPPTLNLKVNKNRTFSEVVNFFSKF